MKSFYNKLNVIITIFFLLGILFSGFNLFNLPAALEKASGRIDLTVIRDLSPVLNQTYLIVGLSLALGLISVILALYLLNYTKTEEKIIYVEKSDNHKEEEEQRAETNRKADLAKQVKSIQAGALSLVKPEQKFEKLLSNLCMEIEASQGIIYAVKKEKSKRFIELFASFAYHLPDSKTIKYEFGEGLAGQVAKEGKKINIKDIPEGYITVISGLGASSPNHLAILPVKVNGEVAYVAEIASFREISQENETLITEALAIENTGSDTGKKAPTKSAEKKEKK
jgi:hypothetical protein